MATVREALRAINTKCDGAVSDDKMGFNGRDAGFAKSLLKAQVWTFNMEMAAYKLLKKYSTQLLKLHNIKYENIEIPQEKPKKTIERQLELDITLDYFTIKSSFSEKDFIKTLPGRTWNAEEKLWTCPATPAFMRAVLKNKNLFTNISEPAKRKLNNIWKGEQNLEKVSEGTQQTLSDFQDLSAIKSYIKAEYFSHQRKAFEALISNPYYALFLEQRVGKTYPIVGAIGYRAEVNGVRKILVCAPKTVTYELEEALLNQADYPVEVYLLDESLEERKAFLKDLKYTGVPQVILINYDVLKRMEMELVKWAPEYMILDESHHIKNGKAQQTKACWAIGKKAFFRNILTGTPISESPLNIWAQYRFLDNTIFGKSFVRFRDRYAIMGGYMDKQVVGLRTIPSINNKKNFYYDPNLSQEFTEKVYSIASRITLSEAKEKNEIEEQESLTIYKYADLEPRARQLYIKMEKEALLEIEGMKLTAPIVLTKLLRLQQICGGFIKLEKSEDYTQVSSAKLEVLEKVLLDYKGKIVIFAKFIPEVEAITRLARKLNISHHVLTGKTKNRRFIREDFQNNPNPKLFISQIGTGGEGITLSAADTCIFFSTGVSFIEFDQAKARIKNLVKTSQLIYIHIVAKNTRDEIIVKLLSRKQDIATMSVDTLRKLIIKEEESMARLPKKVEEVMENKPAGGESFDAEVSRLLDEIEKDLENYGKKENPKKTKEEFFNELRKKTQEKGNTKKKVLDEKKEKEILQKKIKNEGTVTLADLGVELKQEPKEMRKVLRAKNIQKPEGGRWEWAADDPQLQNLRKLFKNGK